MSNGVHAACSVFELFLGVLVGIGLILLVAFGVIAGLLSGLGAAAGTIAAIIGIIALILVLLFAYCIFRRLWRCCFGGGRC
ncbi:ABC transporter [Mesobacillus subterraneus]|uniref:ABC transporter n=1 Tax=Mesobacillus subterraneus TaxID=285983 RepID=A0A3R9EBX4_9BACI|nr:ABC transporter [Mesobacillus subterraneus]RSD26867.1 ABC transporter [Mesobacillus subterraneus]